MSDPKKPYVTPQVILVQQRASGDNLTGGCKVNSEDASGGGGDTCAFNDGCFDVGS